MVTEVVMTVWIRLVFPSTSTSKEALKQLYLRYWEITFMMILMIVRTKKFRKCKYSIMFHFYNSSTVTKT